MGLGIRLNSLGFLREFPARPNREFLWRQQGRKRRSQRPSREFVGNATRSGRSTFLYAINLGLDMVRQASRRSGGHLADHAADLRPEDEGERNRQGSQKDSNARSGRVAGVRPHRCYSPVSSPEPRFTTPATNGPVARTGNCPLQVARRSGTTRTRATVAPDQPATDDC